MIETTFSRSCRFSDARRASGFIAVAKMSFARDCLNFIILPSCLQSTYIYVRVMYRLALAG